MPRADPVSGTAVPSGPDLRPALPVSSADCLSHGIPGKTAVLTLGDHLALASWNLRQVLAGTSRIRPVLFIDDPPGTDTTSEASVRCLALGIVISDADIQPLAADLFRVRIPAAMAHALNCYLWLGPDAVTVVDTGWADSAPVIAPRG